MCILYIISIYFKYINTKHCIIYIYIYILYIYINVHIYIYIYIYLKIYIIYIYIFNLRNKTNSMYDLNDIITVCYC